MNFVQLILFLYAIILYHNKVEARSWKLSEKEDLEIEKQLKLLNKAALKTIHTAYGDVYDCVEIHKQPSFDHPLLRNHNISLNEMKSSGVIAEEKNDNFFSNKKFIDLSLKEDKCPLGTVPIRRLTRDDLIREKLGTYNRSLYYADENPDANVAVVRTRGGPKRYSGASGIVTTYKPYVYNQQYSAARFLLKNGPDSIEVGWRVDPVLYGDNLCRLYIRTMINHTAFFGVRSPGFMLTASEIPIESLLVPSRRGGAVYVMRLIVQRATSGNWVLIAGEKLEQVGYWPKEIFTSEGLQQLASYVEWGGEAYSEHGTVKPPMGSGEFPEANSKLDCLYYQVRVKDENGFDVVADDLSDYADTMLYRVVDAGVHGDRIGHIFFFGGPSGVEFF